MTHFLRNCRRFLRKTQNSRVLSGVALKCVAMLVALFACLTAVPQNSLGAKDLSKALRRAQYLLQARLPTDTDFKTYAASEAKYQEAVRRWEWWPGHPIGRARGASSGLHDVQRNCLAGGVQPIDFQPLQLVAVTPWQPHNRAPLLIYHDHARLAP